MSDTDDEDYAFFGSPLEPLDEGEIPSKKPILIQDQIATDKHGLRRFHGAFTGGFSAGFFNTVGTLEGWKPSQFKSSRSDKAQSFSQRPEDFMDDEDTDDFGIAPIHLRAKPEYSGSAPSKRKLGPSDGPIPGIPVLHNILEPSSVTVGMKLLIKLGWKPGQGIGPMLTWAQKMGDDTDPEEFGLDPKILFPPSPVEELCIKFKSDKFGLGYVGLSKEPVLQQRFSLFDNPLKIKENNKKLSIRGQAFGVGAFEEEDEDIYAKDDMSRYDFALETSSSLREARQKEKEKEKLAICEAFDCIEGFQPSKNKGNRKKYYPPPDLPNDFNPNVTQRKSRFDSEIKGNPSSVGGKHIMNAEDRAAILGENFQKLKNHDVPPEHRNGDVKDSSGSSSNDLDSSTFRPFISDPAKQARYDKYLYFIRIGAKDALKSIQPPEMTEWERERESNEFDQAAKLYRPLSGVMGEKFSRGGMLDDSMDPLEPVAKTKTSCDPWVIAAKEKKFGKLTRFTSDWDPVPLLCKRMNIPEPRNSGSAMAQVAEEANKRKSKFSVFDFMKDDKHLESYTKLNSDDVLDSDVVANKDEENIDLNTYKEDIALPAPLLDPKIVEAEDPKEKIDLFKAIFASDEESDVEEAKEENEKLNSNERPLNNKNILRNTSPPRGIFANLDLDALKPKPLPLLKDNKTDLKTNQSSTVESKCQPITEALDPNMFYGPILPSKPVFIPKLHPNEVESDSFSSSEEEWVEKSEEKHKNKKQSKKNKKAKKKDRHKKKKKKKR